MSTVDPLYRAVQHLSDAFRPVMIIEDGSGKRRAIGTAVVLSDGSRRTVVTAEHVVAGPEEKLVGVANSDAFSWPRRYSRLEATQAGLPDPDLAWATAFARPNEVALATPIPLGLAHSPLQLADRAQLVAVGYPASRAKFRDCHTALANQLMAAVVELAPREVYSSLQLDARVHFAVRYDRQLRSTSTEGAMAGANPKGMSGGALLLMMNDQSETDEQLVVPFMIGILTQYHHGEPGTLVATRTECLRDGLRLGRFSGGPLFRRVAA